MPRKFDMKSIRRRVRKKMRSKHKKTVKLSEVDQIFKDWVQIAVIDRLVKYGKVQVDNHMTLEIVGKKELKVIYLKNGKQASTANINMRRPGLTYKVIMTDDNYKNGTLIFTPSELIKDAVSHALRETSTYYRISQ